MTAFQLSMTESWENAAGEYRERKNRITIEVVGKDSARIAEEVRLGSWVSLEGYIRSEQSKGQELMKVRTLSIDVWEEEDTYGQRRNSSHQRGGASSKI